MNADDKPRRSPLLQWCTLLGGLLTINFLLGFLMPREPALPYPEYELLWKGMNDSERRELVPDMRWQANEQAKAKHAQLRGLWMVSGLGPILLACALFLRTSIGHDWLRRFALTKLVG